MTGHESEGTGVPAQEADGELSLARVALAEQDFEHVSIHLANAFAIDPSHRPVYAVLDELVDAIGGTARAIELFDGRRSAGPIAVLAALRARTGELERAVELLAELAATRPFQPWTAAPWFSARPATELPQAAVVRAVRRICSAVLSPPPGMIGPLTPWLDVARAFAAAPETTANALHMFSTLARRQGAIGEAVAWGEEALRRQTEAGHVTRSALVSLGFAYRAADRPDDAIRTWQQAVEADPTRIGVPLDIAETCIAIGRHDDAIAWADRAASIDGGDARPKGARAAATYLKSTGGSPIGDLAPLIALADLARTNPDRRYLRRLLTKVCRDRPWCNRPPWPTESIVDVTRQMLAAQPTDEQTYPNRLQVRMSALESPSAIASFLALFPHSDLTVMDVPEPDIRVPPRHGFGPPLWTYRRTRAIASVPPASPIAVEKLYQTVTGYWRHPLGAYDGSVGLAGLDEADLLGLLAHVPPPPATEPWPRLRKRQPMLWPRIAQAWVCAGILHLHADQPWPSSDRRALLLRLLFGPEDWTVDAAAFGLCVSAWMFPGQRSDIARVIGWRYLDALPAMYARATELHDPLAHVVLLCPDMVTDIAETARMALAARAGDAELHGR